MRRLAGNPGRQFLAAGVKELLSAARESDMNERLQQLGEAAAHDDGDARAYGTEADPKAVEWDLWDDLRLCVDVPRTIHPYFA
ncbi:hypothetical protein ACFU98_09225 [Streptomyces sp. NPDC057575]|uniref:hypothetical protein n=1 Tax=unclassified Streptomyces TaxID=2593676 RepID=UPI003676A720